MYELYTKLFEHSLCYINNYNSRNYLKTKGHNVLKPITFLRSASFTWNQVPLTMKLTFSYNKLIHINKNNKYRKGYGRYY